jgi:FkbM family methyltransferase
LDSNPIYEESLKAIKEAVGGHYRICAITDHTGEVEFTQSIHPYWSSIQPADDPYWVRVNNLTAAKVRVPATTLDFLAKDLDLKPPFLLKLDIQGAEIGALTGASEVLRDTNVVICEADIADFSGINALLEQSGFVLYDVTGLSRLEDGTLGWFYPVYAKAELKNCFPKSFWNHAQNEGVIRMQETRREDILRWNAETLQAMKAQRLQKASRNQPCPCGSGRKYKHCHGSIAPSGL